MNSSTEDYLNGSPPARSSTMTQPFHDHFSGVANRYGDFRPHYPSALFDYLAR